MARLSATKSSIDFFAKWAGSSYKAGATPAQKRASKLSSARAYAEAEIEAVNRNWKVIWEDDPEGWDSLGDIDPSEVEEVLSARLVDENGRTLASLGSITFGKNSVESRAYGRVVEAELALEALSRKG